MEADASLLALLYGTVGKADGWPILLDALARLYPGGKALLATHDVTFRNSAGHAGGQWEPDQFAAYNQHFVAVNPWIPNLAKRPIGRVTPAEFLLPQADLIKTEFYQDFLRRARLDSGVGVTVQRDGTRHLVVSVMFPHATAERDPDAVSRLQRLVPHLLRVAQLNRELAVLETRAVAAETALDRLATAMLVVNTAGQVVYLNTAAESIIAAGDGLTIVHKTLDAANPHEGQILRHLVTAALQAQRNITASPGGVMRITRTSGRTPYEVLVAPLADTTIARGFSGPMAAAFVRDPETQSVSPVDWLQRLYALTGAEARLMQALLAGDTLDATAERLCVGKETLRSQLKSIFVKTGTGSQAGLIRLGLRGLAASSVSEIAKKT